MRVDQYESRTGQTEQTRASDGLRSDSRGVRNFPHPMGTVTETVTSMKGLVGRGGACLGNPTSNH